MKNFRDFLREELKNPEFKREWDATEEEYQAEVARIRAELAANKNVPVLKKYDANRDVMRVYFSWYCDYLRVSSEEPVHNIYVIYDDDTDEIVGFKILDYKKNVDKAREMYPQYDFSLPQ